MYATRKPFVNMELVDNKINPNLFKIWKTSFFHNIALVRGMLAKTLQRRHNESDDVSIHQRVDYMLNRLFRCRSKKPSKLRVTDRYEGNPPVTGCFPYKGSVTR